MRSWWRWPESRRLVGVGVGGVGVAGALAVLVLGLSIPGPAASAGDDAEIAAGRALFVSGATPPCATCHTLKDAGATGTVGPVLDDLHPDEDRVAAAVRGGVGLMPSYAGSLTDAQIRAVARYVAKASGGAR